MEDEWGTRVHLCARGLVWLLPLPLALLAVGAVIAATDPYWPGTLPSNLSNSPQDMARQPDVASGASGHMVAVWGDQRTATETAAGIWNIYTASSSDSGHTWSAPQVVSETAEESLLPAVLTVGDRDLVAWVDHDPAHVIYEAEIGQSAVRAVPLPGAFRQTNTRPFLAASEDRVYLAFNGSITPTTIPDIFVTSRLLTETTWATATVVYTHTAINGSWYPALAPSPDGKTLHLVWEERTTMHRRAILYITGTVSGADVDWHYPAVELSTGITNAIYPNIAVDSAGDVHVVWGEVIGTGFPYEQDQYVRYVRYDVAGGQWLSPSVRIDDDLIRVNKDKPTYIAPSLALFGGGDVKLCVSWHGFREGGSVEEVLVNCSEDGGDSWGATQNVSRSAGDDWSVSILPSIAFDALGRLHSVWQERAGDDLFEDYEIYWSRELEHLLFLPLVVRNY